MTAPSPPVFLLVLLWFHQILVCSGWSCDDIESPTNATLSFRSLALVDPEAVCNDGSSGGYYIDHGDPSLWLIYLGGGSWCWDAESCAERWENGCPQSYSNEDNKISCMSNASFSNTCAKSGIFDRNTSSNPALATATLVYVPYCTSDAHMGDVPASDSTYGWAFRGARVVRAVVADLQKNEGLGITSAPRQRLVMGGGSAGARGSMVLLDEITGSLSESVDVVGFLDSPMIMDVGSYAPSADASFNGFAEQHQQVYGLIGGREASVVPESCAALYARASAGVASDGAWRCLMGQYRLPLLEAPLSLVAFRFDSYQLSSDLGSAVSPGALDDGQEQYAENFGTAARILLGGLASASAPTRAIFSPACWNHHQSENSNFWTITAAHASAVPNGLSDTAESAMATRTTTTMADFLHRYLQGAVESNTWMDSCVQANCGAGCSS